MLSERIIKLFLNVLFVHFPTLKAIEYGEQVEKKHFDRTPCKKCQSPGETQQKGEACDCTQVFRETTASPGGLIDLHVSYLDQNH